jgi:prepilin-type N-terminal cleavage/methylation domain-containing protein
MGILHYLYYNYFMKIKHLNKKAFTLIELLVAVLIIGILGAIALPQYRKAVAKSRMSEALSNVTVIAEAQERNYLINSSYTDDMADIDINMPGMTPASLDEEGPNFKVYKVGNYLYGLTSYGSAVIFYPAQGPLEFFIEKINTHSANTYRNRLICCSYGNKRTVYDDICENISGVYIDSVATANGTRKRWYKI